MAIKLKDIDVAEISLVDSAANRKKFIIKKRSNNMKLAELLESIIDEKDELQPILLKIAKGEDLTDEEIAKAKEIPEKDFKGTQGALNILQKYVDVYPPDYLNAIRTLVKKAIYGEVDSGDGETEISNEELVKQLEDVEKAGARLSKATIAQLKKIIENLQKMVETSEAKIKKGEDEKFSAETMAKLEKLTQLEKEEKERIEKEKKDEEKTRDEAIADLKKMVENLAKRKPVRTSIEGQEGEEGEKGEEGEVKKGEEGNKWPSLTGQGEEE